MVIYKITNRLNGLIYVGKDASNTPGYMGTGARLKYAINDFGIENFSKEIIEHGTRETINEREIYWIAKLDARNPLVGYNILPGGDGFPLGHKIWKGRKHSRQTRLKMSLAQSGVRHYLFGKHPAETTIEKYRLRSSSRNPNYGKHWSASMKEHMSDIKLGSNSVWFGKKHSEETLEKMRLAALEREKRKRELRQTA